MRRTISDGETELALSHRNACGRPAFAIFPVAVFRLAFPVEISRAENPVYISPVILSLPETGKRKSPASPILVSEQRRNQGVRLTTEGMHRWLARAVVELRARMGWGEVDLADQITKYAARLNLDGRPNQVCVSRWENGETAPSQQHRMVLARIAAKNGHEDLAGVYLNAGKDTGK
jgi:hypothetical protein